MYCTHTLLAVISLVPRPRFEKRPLARHSVTTKLMHEKKAHTKSLTVCMVVNALLSHC